MESLKIKGLQVQNFRNLENKMIEFRPGINCIFGKNGNGKTNILEAIYLLGNKKSFRKNVSFPQILGLDSEKLEIIFSSLWENSDESEEFTLSGKVTPEGNKWFLNSRPAKKRPFLPMVFVNPFDAQSFFLQASFRRHWIDHYFSQLSPLYRAKLSQYNSQLKMRNSLLGKKPPYFREQIRAIDPDFLQSNLDLTDMREDLLRELDPFFRQTFQNLFDSLFEIDLQLSPHSPGPKHLENLYSLAKENTQKDEIVGHTTWGVHKDDYLISIDGLSALSYGSLGQQKMAYLGLLFAYIELFRYKLGSFPIVLLDDVSGELDGSRWGNLVRFLAESKFQVLITTANEGFKTELENLEGANQIFVEEGSIYNIH